MSEYTLYRTDLPKPYFMLKLDYGCGSKEWLIPDNKNLDFRNHKRLAFENIPPLQRGVEEPHCGSLEMDKGELELRSETRFKIEFSVRSDTENYGLNGSYVLMVPSWGRKTTRRTWVLIPSRGTN